MEFRARRLVARVAHPGSWHVVKRWNFPNKHRDEFGDFEPWRARTGTCKSSRGVMSSNALSSADNAYKGRNSSASMR